MEAEQRCKVKKQDVAGKGNKDPQPGPRASETQNLICPPSSSPDFLKGPGSRYLGQAGHGEPPGARGSKERLWRRARM